MLKNKRNFFFFSVFFFSLCVPFFPDSFSDEAVRLYQEICILEEWESRFVGEDLALCTEEELVTYFIFLSGKEDQKRLKELLAFYRERKAVLDFSLRKEYGTLQVKLLPLEIQKQFAESVNEYMHSIFFRKYQLDTDRFSSIKDNGSFNCVSSSILYAILLTSYGISTVPVETKEHVFLSLIFPDGSIDVETTTPLGFNPGEKKEVLDELGKVTGFSYVPQKNYTDRNNIDLKRLLLLLVHNESALLTRQGKHEEALKLAYLIKEGRADEKGAREFFICYYNWVTDFSEKRKLHLAWALIELYRKVHEGDNEQLISLQYNILNDMVVRSKSLEEYLKLKTLLEERKRISGRKWEKHCQELMRAVNFKIVEWYSEKQEIENAYRWIEQVQRGEEREKLLSYLFYRIEQRSRLNGDYGTGIEQLREAKKYALDSSKEYKKYQYVFWGNYTNDLIQKKNYQRALELLQAQEELSQEEKERLLKIVYIGYAHAEFQKENYQSAILLSKQALNLLGDDAALSHNLKIYYIKYIQECLEKGKEEYADSLKQEAKLFFPNEKYFSSSASSG